MKRNRPKRRNKKSRNRYAAKLLFQFRVVVNGASGKRRICEERTILLEADSARKALTLAKKAGSSAQYRYRNDEGNPVFFEFVGVRELLCLGAECETNEVWYDIRQLLYPMERKSKLIPPERKLNAIHWGN
jgi:hypothetical protein